MIRISNPSRGKRFMYPPKRTDRLWGPSILLFGGYRQPFPRRGKRPGREADHSSASGAHVKKDWSCTSTLHLCLRGVEREKNLTFTSVISNSTAYPPTGPGCNLQLPISLYHWLTCHKRHRFLIQSLQPNSPIFIFSPQ